ncbi:MAG: FkbM family methyltransferase [Bacteroidales bacterium]|nr:FkbM family methyltransferase [Bacteroidales bacterium]
MKNLIKKVLYFKLPIKIGEKSFLIPIIKGVGINNLRLKNDWFIFLLNRINLPEHSYFIDVGVNIGQTLLKFRSHFDNPYYGFELNSNCVRYTRKLIKTNGIKDISIFPVGLSDKDEVVALFSNDDIDNCCTDSTIVQNLRPNRYTDNDKSFVPVFRFDNLKLLKAGDCLSMIKIDVEGAELEVIKGMIETIKEHRPLITCEVLDYYDSNLSSGKLQDKANKLYDLIRSLDYDVYAIKQSNSNLNFEKLSEIKLNLWTPESLKSNDYLFIPANNKYIYLKGN